MNRDDFDGAVAAFREGLRYRPESAELHAFLSKALARKGQQADSRAHLHNAIELAPSEPHVQKLIRELEAELSPVRAP